MFGLRPIALILCMALAAGPLSAPVGAGGTATTPHDYARREAAAVGLEEFRGGFHGVVIGVFLVAVVATAICLDLTACPYCVHGSYYEELPPAHDRRGPVRP
jgi:hypothetical protein